MIFLIITTLVVAALAYSYVGLRKAYGARTLGKLFFLTPIYFFVKELLQSRNLLLTHYYHTNHVIWFELLGVPPFVVFGHLFVVLMTWQLAVLYTHKLRLTRHPVVFLTLVWYFTSAFSMLMENTGVVGGWWSWAMPSWWYYPNIFGAPLVGLPWERPITTAWGYFISTYWFVLLITDFPRRWTLLRFLVLVAGLAAVLELSRLTLFMSLWELVLMPGLPFVSVCLTSSNTVSKRRLLLPVGSRLLEALPSRWNGPVALGLAAMVVVCVVQIVVVGKWLALVSLFPIGVFALGAHRSWPVWIDCALSLAAIVAGYLLNNGNLILAGWLVFRCRIVVWLLLGALRWRERRDALLLATPRLA